MKTHFADKLEKLNATELQAIQEELQTLQNTFSGILNFEKAIQRTDKMTLVDFYATWSEPCLLIAPVLEKLEMEFEE